MKIKNIKLKNENIEKTCNTLYQLAVIKKEAYKCYVQDKFVVSIHPLTGITYVHSAIQL